MAFEVGQIVSDYEIVDILGKGGMGRVYRVRNVISNRVEAMKVLLADLAGESELGDRFAGEIRTLARLDHQNIAKLHTAFKAANQLVMVMEFVEGFTLSERMRQGPLPLDDVLSYVTQTLAALAYAHSNGVIHRDIKPSNIMVTPHGIVKLMDFGIAKSNTDTMHTRAGTTMGSMLYMSPEQVRGTNVDARSDLYSMGVVLYELTAGRRPFESESTYAVLEAQLNTTPQPPLNLNPSVPQALNDIIMTALEKEPMRRFQSADAFRKALESLKSPQTVPQSRPAAANAPGALPSAMPVPSPRPAANRTLWMAGGAIACVSVLIAGAIAMPHFWHSHAATAPNTATQSIAAVSSPAAPPGNSSPQSSTQAAPNPSPSVVVPPVDDHSQNRPVSAVSQSVHERRVRKESPGPADPGGTPVNDQSGQPAASSSAPVAVASAPAVAGPSQQEIDKAQEDLMQMHSRADAVRGSVNNLKRQQSADGFEISPEISGAVSRLDNYLQAADRAAQSNDLSALRRYMDGAEKQLTFLEGKFGR